MKKQEKVNLNFMAPIKYCHNNKIYICNDGIFKEDLCDRRFICNCIIEDIYNDEPIKFNFDINEYFKVNLNLNPWADCMYLYYINQRHILKTPNVELKAKDDIVIASPYDNAQDIMICFINSAQKGVYKSIIKYNYYRIIKEIGCNLYAPLDIRKPFKLVIQNQTSDNSNSDVLTLPTDKRSVNERIIGEINQEYGLWYIYHPLQIRTTLTNIRKEKEKISNSIKIVDNSVHKLKTKKCNNFLNLSDEDYNEQLSKLYKEKFILKTGLSELSNECLRLKDVMLADDADGFKKLFADFWE